MPLTRARLAYPLALLLLTALARTAHADDTATAREFNTKAMSAYALGRYGDAATYYEKAFEAKPLPELLYNAAQANRLAGNKKRALELYQNYLRVFGPTVSNAVEVNKHIEALKKAIDSDNSAASSPPLAPAPMPPPGAAPPDLRVASAPATPAPPLAAPEAPADRPIYKKGWFWGVISGVAAVLIAGVAVAVVLSGGSPVVPMPTIGAAKVF
jgi:tetratricopeptide (TPR) repeat protein